MVEQTQDNSVPTPRQTWMSLLSRAPEGAVRDRLKHLIPKPDYSWLRAPEIGTVMVRGRTSGTGAAFNLGEMTVTRCVLKLDSGVVGHAYVQGRRKQCAEAAALVDALMQTDFAETVQTIVIDPLQADIDNTRTDRAAKAEATKVDFFTMARGED